MVLLGFDTATPLTVVALRLADGTTLEACDDPQGDERPGHATRLLPMADTLLEQASVGWSDIDRIAVGTGPGTFTGLRIGVATARALAQSLSVSIVGVSSLRALAHAVVDHHRVLSVIDARRGEVFVGAYIGERQIVPPTALQPHALASVLPEIERGERWLAVGGGTLRFPDDLRTAGFELPESSSPLHRISASALCELGSLTTDGDLATVLPEYCRRPDAEIALESAKR